MGYYDYERFVEKARNDDPAAINDLGEWLEEYGERYWNGEYWEVEGIKIRPDCEKSIDEDGEETFDYSGYVKR